MILSRPAEQNGKNPESTGPCMKSIRICTNEFVYPNWYKGGTHCKEIRSVSLYMRIKDRNIIS